MNDQGLTKDFYDNYWPKNIPAYQKTEEHIFTLLPEKEFFICLDAGCGTGVCSLALSKKVKKVVSCDLSLGSLKAASLLKNKLTLENINLVNASLLDLPFKNQTFDMILSWGVIHHTIDPEKAFWELNRVLKKDGYLIVAVYLKTKITFLHEFLRRICLKIKSIAFKMFFIKIITYLVKFLELFGKKTNVRDDNTKIESQVEDWFFVPVKHFFSIEELKKIFNNYNLTFEVLCQQTGRLKSSSNVIVRGVKKS